MLADMLANEIRNNGMDGKDSIISDYLTLIEDATPSDYIQFFSALIERMGSLISLTDDDDNSYEIFSSSSPSKISYVKNNYSDAAFMRFSSLFKLPKVAYGASFEDACESVYNAASDYCILPIENAANGKLFSFYSLIDKYDLKIFAF